MRRTVVHALAVLGVLIAVLTHCAAREGDGAPCEESSDCKSERCERGYCYGSSCKTDADCNDGWVCTPGGSGLLGFGGSGPTCEPHCGACPPSMYCDDGAGAGRACTLGKKPLSVLLEKPPDAIVGDPVTLRASVRETTGAVKRVTWGIDNGTGGADTSPDLTLTRSFDTSAFVQVSVEDESGRTGSASMNVVPKCRAEGRECRAGLCCTGEGDVRCLSGATSTGLVCRLAVVPFVTISGPATATKDQPVTFSVDVKSDAPVTYVEWSFGTIYRRGEYGQLSFTYAFSYAGDIPIVARARDELGMIGEGKSSIC